MEHAPQRKPDEQFPLLRVETGGGDGKTRNSIPANGVATEWNVRCTPKQTWCTRWPEYVSAFWMTLILLAISFLVFYALGMGAYRRQPIVIVGCNNTKPGNDVFYHHIIPRDAYVPFSIYSDYLAFMAKRYPSIFFTVYFLINDSWQSPYHSPRVPNSRLLNRMVPQLNNPFNMVLNRKRDIKDFQNRYQNVNICIMLLSKYMAKTPLKYKWKMIPQNHLSFYTRIFEIWQNGGIAFDLESFNNQFINNGELDRRIDAILKNHNNGMGSEKYAEVLNSLDEQEQNELFSTFFHLINHILNETRSFFDIGLTPNVTVVEDTPKIGNHKSKRYIENNLSVLNATNKNYTLSNNHTQISNETRQNTTMRYFYEIQPRNRSSQNNTYEKLTIGNISENYIPKSLFFYDFYSVLDDAGPPYFFLKYPGMGSSGTVDTKYPIEMMYDQKKSNYLLLSPEGHFVATSSRYHPLLTNLFSSSCLRLSPKIAIKDALLSQCSGYLRNDNYCENIRVIYNAI